MSILENVNSIINKIITDELFQLYKRWNKEYKQRFYESQRDTIGTEKPKKHSGYPGFENNIISILYNVLKEEGYEQHCEWPYASQIEDSRKKADIHFIMDNNEIWFELGMYATDESTKYSKDFQKLLSLVKIPEKKNVGVLIHFEINEKNRVPPLFKQFKDRYKNDFSIDYKEFKSSDKFVVCRLVIKQKIKPLKHSLDRTGKVRA